MSSATLKRPGKAPYQRGKKQPSVVWSITLMIGGLILASVSLANPSLQSRFDDVQLSHAGTPVRSMPSASAIQDWAAEDSLNVLVQIAEEGVFRLTFTEDCYNLRWANNVGLSGSQNKVWAGFDYLTVDGQRCSIGSINRLVDKL